MQLTIFTPPNVHDFFSKDWFFHLFNSYPILKRFVTTQMIISTDEMQKMPKITKWQYNLYQALKALSLSGVQDETRYSELERTIFSIMFIEAIRLWNKGGKEFIQSVAPKQDDFTDEDYQKINNLLITLIPNFANGGEALNLFFLSCIFGDIAKIHAVREDLKSPTADQDLALDFILASDISTLKIYFSKLTEEQIKHLKKWYSPLHLGHAAQLECAESKFQEVLDTKCDLSHIKYAIAKQIADVAGARAQNGILLLNSKILQTYIILQNILEGLVKEKNASVAYKKYLDMLAPPNFFQQIQFIKPQEDLYIVQRLFCQLRLQQMSAENFMADSSTILHAFCAISNTAEFRQYIETIMKYDSTRLSVTKFVHTPTYVPAVFSSLLNLYNSEKCSAIANDKYTFALIVGCKIVSAVLKQYLERVETNKCLLNHPPCFNQLNGLIAGKLELVLSIYSHTDHLVIDENGNINFSQLSHASNLIFV